VSAAEPRYAVEVDVLAHRRLSEVDVRSLAQRAGVDAYRIPPPDPRRSRYRLVGSLAALRAALLRWSSSDHETDHAWALEKLVGAVLVSLPDDAASARVQRGGMTAHVLSGALTGLPGGLLEGVSEVPLWVRYAGQVHEVRRVVQESVGAEESPPGAPVPYSARQRVVVLDLDPPHALSEVALAVGEATP
jgi:hypothetical protein